MLCFLVFFVFAAHFCISLSFLYGHCVSVFACVCFLFVLLSCTGVVKLVKMFFSICICFVCLHTFSEVAVCCTLRASVFYYNAIHWLVDSLLSLIKQEEVAK